MAGRVGCLTVHRAAHEMADDDRLQRDDELAALGPAENEQVLGELTEPVRFVRDVGESLGDDRQRQRVEPLAQDAAHAEDRRDGRSKLVADHADERVPKLVVPLLRGVPGP